MITKQQQRAEFALNQVKKIIEKNQNTENKVVPEKLKNKIVGMPNMILSDGLLQTLAFLLSKKSNEGNNKNQAEEVTIFYILKEYFGEKDICADFSDINTTDEMSVLQSLCDEKMTPTKYIRIQDECLKMLEFLKRYARAFGEKGGN